MANQERCREMFAELDKDDNGAVTFKELSYIMRKCGYSKESIETRFDNIDADDDKMISEEEFMNSLASTTQEEAKENSLRAAFLEFDTDKSGSITREELDTALKSCKGDLSDEDVARVMSCADDSGDGVIDYEEFLKMIAKCN